MRRVKIMIFNIFFFVFLTWFSGYYENLLIFVRCLITKSQILSFAYLLRHYWMRRLFGCNEAAAKAVFDVARWRYGGTPNCTEKACRSLAEGRGQWWSIFWQNSKLIVFEYYSCIKNHYFNTVSTNCVYTT